MELAKLSDKIEFEIDGEIYSVEPCSYQDDEDESTPGLRINFPNGDNTEVGLYNFLDFYQLKRFVISQLNNYKS